MEQIEGIDPTQHEENIQGPENIEIEATFLAKCEATSGNTETNFYAIGGKWRDKV